jgi:hypothetical protein
MESPIYRHFNFFNNFSNIDATVKLLLLIERKSSNYGLDF